MFDLGKRFGESPLTFASTNFYDFCKWVTDWQIYMTLLIHSSRIRVVLLQVGISKWNDKKMLPKDNLAQAITGAPRDHLRCHSAWVNHNPKSVFENCYWASVVGGFLMINTRPRGISEFFHCICYIWYSRINIGEVLVPIFDPPPNKANHRWPPLVGYFVNLIPFCLRMALLFSLLPLLHFRRSDLPSSTAMTPWGLDHQDPRRTRSETCSDGRSSNELGL